MLNKLRFYYSRAAAMSFRETAYRARWKIRQMTLDKWRAEINYPALNKKRLDKRYLRASFRQGKKGNFFFEHLPREEVIVKYRKYFSVKEAKDNADKILRHEIPVFEVKENLGKEIDWNKCYKTGKRWPQKYVGKLHHEDSRYGFVRYVWELNRQSHLAVLAKAYYLTREEKYAEEVLQQIESWIRQNPYLYTINWFSGLELGIRLINCSWALKFIKDYPRLTEERFKRIMKSVELQAETIYHNLSLYSSANNHLTGELAALQLVSTIFPELKNAERWKKKSEKLLLKTFNQIYNEGVGAEQSVNYLLFTLDLYLQAYLISNKEIPLEIQKKMKNSGDFLCCLMDGREKLPEIGDSDDAHLIDLVEDGRDKGESMINTLAVLFSDKQFKHFGRKLDEKTFWLCGLKGVKKYESIKKNKRKLSSRLFAKGGYLISKSKNASLIFDCGRLGYLSTAGHGHADALSFILAVGGKDFFVDSGTYIYHGDKNWRDYFRSTPAHNTLAIDEKNQSEIRGNFIWGKKAKTNIEKYYLNEEKDEITAWHNGYAPAAFPERKIIHDKKRRMIEITDRILTDDFHSVSLFFNLHPEVTVTEKKTGEYLLAREGRKLTLLLEPHLQIKKWRGSEQPIRGWFSPAFGVKMPSICLEAKTVVIKTTVIKT